MLPPRHGELNVLINCCRIVSIVTNNVDAVGPSIGLPGSPRVDWQWLLPRKVSKGLISHEGTALILEKWTSWTNERG